MTANPPIPDPKHRKSAASAHSTPVTDGKVAVTMFGSEGIHAFNMSGKKLWSKNLGYLNAGDFDSPISEWGHASSPILHNGRVFLQCDTPEKDFLVALDSQTGKESDCALKAFSLHFIVENLGNTRFIGLAMPHMIKTLGQVMSLGWFY